MIRSTQALSLALCALLSAPAAFADDSSCENGAPTAAGNFDIMQNIAKSIDEAPTQYLISYEDGRQVIVNDLNGIAEQDIRDEMAARPELTQTLADLQDSAEFAAVDEDDSYSLTETGIQAGAKRHSGKRKPRYSNRGILGPSGKWPVSAGKCTTLSGQASYYGGGEKLKKHTSTGRVFNPNRMAAAHRTLPIGTRVEITNMSNGKKVSGVEISDRGPAIETGREIDVTKGVAKKIGMIQAGHGRVQIRVCRG